MATNPVFLPSDDPPSDEEEIDALEDSLLIDEDDLVITDDPPPPIGRSYAFQMAEKRFAVATGGRGPLGTRGDSTLAYWIEKTLHTAKGAHPIYSSDYGMDDPFGVIGHVTTSSDFATLESSIFDALTFHPRIADVRDFHFDQNPLDEMLAISFLVVKDDGSEFTLSELPIRLG